MRVAFVGKGGSGKTTLATLFSKYLANQNLPVLAIDADINQHLGSALGFSQTDLQRTPRLGEEIGTIKQYLRGKNKRIESSDKMIKTTPPGNGSTLIRFKENNLLYSRFALERGSLRFIAVGQMNDEEVGTKCYHTKTGAVELLLNHLIDGDNEYVVLDMTAGADAFASGLFAKFDLTTIVVEPTIKSVEVWKQYSELAKNYGVKLMAIGNKVEDKADAAFLKKYCGENLAGCFTRSQYVRGEEKGARSNIDKLESENTTVLKKMLRVLDGCKKDWDTFYKQTVNFHIKNALSWANASLGSDLTVQVDPEFSLTKIINK